MNRIQAFFRLALALGVFAATANAAAHTERTTAPRLPFMRGMGFVGFYGYGNDQYARQAAALASLKAKGFDHIRLPVDFRLYSTYDSGTGVATLLDRTYVRPSEWWAMPFYAGFSDFDSIIDNAEAAGLYITLDFHGWFDIDPSDAAQTNQFIALWKAVAERYKDRSNKLIFELANEPNSHNFSAVCNMQKAAIKEIRKTNPTRLILFDPGDGNQPWVLTQLATPPKTSWVSLPDDNNVAVVIHVYHPFWFSHQGEDWVDNPNMTKTGLDEPYYTGTNSQGVAQYEMARETLKENLHYCQQYLDATGVRIVVNEFNVSHKIADHADITEYLSMVTRWCESNNVPWSPWSYCTDGGGMDCTDSSGNLEDYTEAGLFPDLKRTDRFSTNDYPHAIEISFPGYAGASELADFPVLVKLSEEGLHGFRYADFTRPKDGFDLCFTDANGNLLAHEIDTWDTNGVSTVWVKVPSLTAATTITAHYGCAKPIVPKVESVWDSDYVGVWHLGERKLPLADATGVSRDVTSADGTGIGYGAAGVAGGAVDFGAAGSSRSVNADDHRMLDGFASITVEAWTLTSSAAADAGILAKQGEQVGNLSYGMSIAGGTTTMRYSADGTAAVGAGVSLLPAAGRWNHQAFTLDTASSASNSKGYLNGALAGTADVALAGGVFAGDAELHVGNLASANAANFPGRIDEVRISKCVRSADWLQATHDTVAKRGFATYAVRGASAQNPTLHLDIAAGEEAVDASEVRPWTTRIIKDGDGTAVLEPVSGASVTNLTVRRGAVALADSAPASVVSTVGEHVFADGAALDLGGRAYSVANLVGAPDVRGGGSLSVSARWTTDGATPMAVAGALAFGDGATVAVTDASVFAAAGREGVAIATAAGGITGLPALESLDYALKLSVDGKSLLLHDNIHDTADWTAFAKRIAVTFPGVADGVSLENFPALVRLSESIDGFRYADFRREGGGDLRFADATGNLLPHEIDTWDESGVSLVWVKVPTLSAATTITAYYGALHPVLAPDPADVWDDDYIGVWHLGEGALPLRESSATSSAFETAAGEGVALAAEGVAGGAVDFTAASAAAGLLAPDHDALDGFSQFTVEAWLRHNTWSHGAIPLSKRHASNSQTAYYFYEAASGTSTNMAFYVGTNVTTSAKWACNLVPATGVWNHVAYTVDMTQTSKNCKSYLDGARKGNQSVAFLAGAVPATASPLCLGNNPKGSSAMSTRYPGAIDEVRISRCVRSAEWLQATHDTITNPAFAACAITNALGGLFGTPVAFTEIGTQPTALAIDGDTLYCGSGDTLYVLDVSDPLAPRIVGSLGGLCSLRQIDVEGGLLAISSRGGGAWLVDVTDRAAPALLSHIDTVEQATGVAVAGDFLAIGQRTTGVEFFDISDRSRPQHIRLFKTQESQSCRYENGILYSGDWHSGQVNLVDVTDIENARIVGTTLMHGYGDGFDLDGRYIYASTGHHRLRGEVSGSSKPENYGQGHGLEIWDRSDPTNVAFVSRVEFPQFYRQGSDWWSCREADGWVFCADTFNGVFAVDARVPAHACVVDRFCDPSPNDAEAPSRVINSIAVGDGAVYAASNGGGLWAIPCEVARYRAPVRGAPPTAANLAWRDPYATAADSRFRAWIPPERGQVHSVAAYGGFYFAGCSYAGAYVIEAATLRTVGRIPCAYARDVCVRDGLLYVAQGDEGLGIYSLDDPASPREVRRVTQVHKGSPHVEWVYVPTPRWAVCHARRNTGRWYFLDLTKANPAENAYYTQGMDWVRPFADLPVTDVEGRPWLGYARTHSFFQWFDLSGDRPVLRDTTDTASAVAAASRTNYLGTSSCCTPISTNRLLVANSGHFILLDPGQDRPAEGGWPTFRYANASTPKPNGMCSWDGGTRVGLAHTAGRSIQMADFTVEDQPQLLWHESTVGCPENGVFSPDGRFLVPCGYQGLLVEKRDGDDAPAPVVPSVAEAHGYDWTNRVFTVTGLAPGAEVMLDVWAASIPGSAGFQPATIPRAGCPRSQESLFADASGAAAFSVPTAPGALYAFAVATNGVVLASGEFLAGAWDPEGSWFSAAPDGAGGSAEVGGVWTTPPAATNSARYALGAATAFALAPSSSAAGAGRLVHADFAIRYDFLNDASRDLGAVSAGESIAAVTAVANASGGAARWRALVGGAWSDMTCDIAPAPDVDYLLRLEGDFTLSAPRVRLLVSADGGAGFAPLRSADGDEWFAPNDAQIATLSEIATVGEGESALLRGTLSNACVAEANGVRYTSLADALRAAGRGGAVTLLANATAPRSLAVGRAIETNGHLLLTYDDTNFTLFLLK